MSLEVDLQLYRWMVSVGLIKNEKSLQPNGMCLISQQITKLFQNGIKIGQLLVEIYLKKSLAAPPGLTHLKKSTHTAAKLYNWNILNEAMRKLNYEVQADAKNQIINGQHQALVNTIIDLKGIYEQDVAEDSLEVRDDKNIVHSQPLVESNITNSVLSKRSTASRQIGQGDSNYMAEHNSNSLQGNDLLEYVLQVIATKLKLTRKQAIALVADNNKYLAHVYVKGIKGSFTEVEAVLEKFYQDNQRIVGMVVNNSQMCTFYLQLVKPALLSKNEEIAHWACRIYNRLGLDLANNDLLAVAYQWLIRENGGLATTILSLTRHPKLSQSAVGFILQLGRYNVSDLFTVQLRKLCLDSVGYLKFILLIFNSLVESKISAQEILGSGALDYWIELAEKGADSDYRNTVQLRVVSIELLIRIWKAYPIHIEETLHLVNNILNYVKKGIRDDNIILRFTLLELMFDLLNYFARLKNPYASILYKKMTFMFIENHENVEVRENMLANFKQIFQRYQSIPVEIFLEPFIKQLKISQGKTYVLNLFDFSFVRASAEHRKLKVRTAIDLFDFLAKVFLNDSTFSRLALPTMEYLVDRFLDDESFLGYTLKLVKISLAIFFSSLKKRPTNKFNSIDDATRLAMQKRAQIVNFMLYLIKKQTVELSDEIKTLTVHLRLQVVQNYKIQHRGILQILKCFGDPYQVEREVLQTARNQPPQSAEFEIPDPNRVVLPRINSRNSNRDEVMSQHSYGSLGTKMSKGTSRQEFPIKDYEEFETDQEKKFMEQHGIGLKKAKALQARNRQSAGKLENNKRSLEEVSQQLPQQQQRNFKITKNRDANSLSTANNIKVLEHIDKIKERKQEQILRKAKEQEKIQKKKEQLKQKIKKELQQRNLALGKNNPGEKNQEVKVVFEDNQINQKLFEDAEAIKEALLREEQDRDQQSIILNLKKHDKFLKRIFSKYANASNLKKKGTFEDQPASLAHVDLIRMFKEKNVQKNKVVLQQILRIVHKRDTKNGQTIGYQGFLKTLQQYCIFTFYKEKLPSQLMGVFLKEIFRKLASGENTKLEDNEEDQTSRDLSHKLSLNPNIEIPNNYKKVTEKFIYVSRKPTQKTIAAVGEKYAICYSILNELLGDNLKLGLMESKVEFREETRVYKKNQVLPPKPVATKKQAPILLQETEKPEKPEKIEVRGNSESRKNILKTRQSSEIKRTESGVRSAEKGQKIVNAVGKKKLQQEEEKRRKQAEEEQQRKKRALEVKRKLQQQQNQQKQERQKKKQEQKLQKEKQQQRLRKEKENKEQHMKQIKQKLEKRKKEQQAQQQEAKRKKEQEDKKAEDQRKEQLKKRKEKEDEKRKEEEQALRQKKLKEEEDAKQKKLDQERKKEAVRKQAQKRIEADKQKLEQEKAVKQSIKKLYTEPVVSKVFLDFKDQLKSLYAYGLEFNDYQIGQAKNTCIEQKGWLNICQALGLCDTNTATLMVKANIRQRQEKGISFEGMQEIMLGLALKSVAYKKNLPDEYASLKDQAPSELNKYLTGLGIPKQKTKQKDFFVGLKKGDKKPVDKQGFLEALDEQDLEKVEQFDVVNPEGKQEKWGLK